MGNDSSRVEFELPMLEVGVRVPVIASMIICIGSYVFFFSFFLFFSLLSFFLCVCVN